MSRRNYISTVVTQALTPTGGFLRGFAFSLNPYIGCAFGDGAGCPFCYVRALPVAHNQPGSWGSWVVAKANLKSQLHRELAALERAGRLTETTIFMSSATDPYQGIERRMRITRSALELLAPRPIRRLLLQTRSLMVERDLDLLSRMGNRVIVSITLETDDDAVRRAFTPTSPSVSRRLHTARKIREAGIPVQLAISPMMPNHPEEFAKLADKAVDRVIIDTYFAGDGAGGRRSLALKIDELYARLGYAEWFYPGAEQKLLAAMRTKLGEERVLFSKDGFNAV